MKKFIAVVDASSIFNGDDINTTMMYTTTGVAQEIKDEISSEKLVSKYAMLQIRDPSEESIRKVRERMYDLNTNLSIVDTELVALFCELHDESLMENEWITEEND